MASSCLVLASFLEFLRSLLALQFLLHTRLPHTFHRQHVLPPRTMPARIAHCPARAFHTPRPLMDSFASQPRARASPRSTPMSRTSGHGQRGKEDEEEKEEKDEEKDDDEGGQAP